MHLNTQRETSKNISRDITTKNAARWIELNYKLDPTGFILGLFSCRSLFPSRLFFCLHVLSHFSALYEINLQSLITTIMMMDKEEVGLVDDDDSRKTFFRRVMINCLLRSPQLQMSKIKAIKRSRRNSWRRRKKCFSTQKLVEWFFDDFIKNRTSNRQLFYYVQRKFLIIRSRHDALKCNFFVARCIVWCSKLKRRKKTFFFGSSAWSFFGESRAKKWNLL